MSACPGLSMQCIFKKIFQCVNNWLPFCSPLPHNNMQKWSKNTFLDLVSLFSIQDFERFYSELGNVQFKQIIPNSVWNGLSLMAWFRLYKNSSAVCSALLFFSDVTTRLCLAYLFGTIIIPATKHLFLNSYGNSYVFIQT